MQGKARQKACFGELPLEAMTTLLSMESAASDEAFRLAKGLDSGAHVRIHAQVFLRMIADPANYVRLSGPDARKLGRYLEDLISERGLISVALGLFD